jgi:hypothetical protein
MAPVEMSLERALGVSPEGRQHWHRCERDASVSALSPPARVGDPRDGSNQGPASAGERSSAIGHAGTRPI